MKPVNIMITDCYIKSFEFNVNMCSFVRYIVSAALNIFLDPMVGLVNNLYAC